MKDKTRELTKGTPGRELGVLDEMDRMFENFFAQGWRHPFRDLWPDWVRSEEGTELRTPRVDVIDENDALLVKAEVPGVKREDLSVELAGGLLTIKGETHHEDKVKKGDVIRAEISHGAFRRSVPLPSGLDDAHVTADFRDGVLEVRLPKTAQTLKRRIEVG